jgi:elongation factor 2
VDAIMGSKPVKTERLLQQAGVVLKADERKLRGKDLLKLAMQRWIPAADAVLEMVSRHHP